MAKITVTMFRGNDDHYSTEMEEETLMRLLGCGGNCYEYGDTIEIHYEKGYIKRKRLSGSILKAVYFC